MLQRGLTIVGRQMIAFIKEKKEEQPIGDPDLVACIWLALVKTVDWSKPTEVEALTQKKAKVSAFMSAIL